MVGPSSGVKDLNGLYTFKRVGTVIDESFLLVDMRTSQPKIKPPYC